MEKKSQCRHNFVGNIRGRKVADLKIMCETRYVEIQRLAIVSGQSLDSLYTSLRDFVPDVN